MENVGGRIRAAREKAGLRRETLAGRIGWSANALMQWENGKSLPKLDAIESLAAALGVSPSELCGWQAPQPPPAPKPGFAELREKLARLTCRATAEQLRVLLEIAQAIIQ